MENTDLILVDDFCLHYQISYSFINELIYAGLVEVTVIEERNYLPVDRLSDLEKLTRIHADLGVNQEGVEAIAHLLSRVHDLQKKVFQLTERLAYYERH